MHRTAVRALVCLLLLALLSFPAYAAADREPPPGGAALLALERLWEGFLDALAPWAATVSHDRSEPGEPAEPSATEEAPPATAPTSDLGGTMDPDG